MIMHGVGSSPPAATALSESDAWPLGLKGRIDFRPSSRG